MRDEGYDLIDEYLPLDKIKYFDPEGWNPCSKCKALPCLWIFDNGSHACCKCFQMYGGASVTSESIMSVYCRTGNTIEYDQENLKKAWNIFAEHGTHTPLEKGRW